MDNKTQRFIIVIVILLGMIYVSSAVVFNDGTTTVWRNASSGGGFYVGNTSINTTDLVTTNIEATNYTTSQGRHLENGDCDASYCVRYNLTNSSIIEAVNGSTGEVDYSGTNFSNIINNISAGNYIQLTEGTFNSITLSLSTNLTLSGMGDETIINSIITDNNSDLIEINGTDSPKENVNIINLKIQGNNVGRHGIVYRYTDGGIVEGVTVENVVNTAIMAYIGTNNINIRNNEVLNAFRGIYLDGNVSNSNIIGNQINNVTTDCIELDDVAGSPRLYPVGNIIASNIVSDCGFYGILVEGANDNIVANNQISNSGNTNYAGIGITGGDGSEGLNNTASNNHIRNVSGSGVGIKNSFSRNTTISGNDIFDVGLHGIIINIANYSNVYGNNIRDVNKSLTDAYSIALVGGSNNNYVHDNFLSSIYQHSSTFSNKVTHNIGVSPYSDITNPAESNFNMSNYSISNANISWENNNINLQDSVINDDGLVIDMRFRENNNGTATITTLYDSSNNPNDGVWYGSLLPTWTSDRFGIQLNGTTDYVQFLRTPIIPQNSSVAIEIITKPTLTQGTSNYVFAKAYGSTAGGRAGSLLFSSVNAFRFISPLSATTTIALDGTSKTQSEPYHVIGQYNHTTGLAELYVDGNLENSTNVGLITTPSGVSPAYLGSEQNTGSPTYYSGFIYRVKIYKKTFTSTEVKTKSHSASQLYGDSGLIQTDNFRIINNTGYNIFNLSNTGQIWNNTAWTYLLNQYMILPGTNTSIDYYDNGSLRISATGVTGVSLDTVNASTQIGISQVTNLQGQQDAQNSTWSGSNLTIPNCTVAPSTQNSLCGNSTSHALNWYDGGNWYLPNGTLVS